MKKFVVLSLRKIEFPIFLFVFTISLMFSSGSTLAGTPNWIKSTVNGNFFTLTPRLSWTDAEAWANEWGGHLVTLRSGSEELWTKQTFGAQQHFWIGLNVIGREPDSANYFWSSGEPVIYTNWARYEPTACEESDEDATIMNSGEPYLGVEYGNYWNDLPSYSTFHGIAEIVTSDELGLVLSCTGEVYIVRGDPQTEEETRAKKGDLIKAGDRFRTYEAGLVEVAFPAIQGYRTFIVYPDSEIKVGGSSTPSETTLDFSKGKIKSIMEGLPEDYLYEIITPQFSAGVRGTAFIVEGDESSTQVTVLEGSVEVTNLDSTQHVTVNENYAVQASTEDLGEPYLVGNEPEYFAGGFGTETDPWLIETAGHLNNVRYFLGEEYKNRHFKQIADIDLNEAPWNEGEGWVPIGTADSAFYGNYIGDGKEISHLYIHRDTAEYQGLFGCNNGAISNLGVMDASVTDHGGRAGILTGLNNLGVIENCQTSGSIQSEHEEGGIGGLTGWNYNIIKDSHSTATVSTTGKIAGGLTGMNYGGSIINCFTTGDVNSESIQAGGLAGHNSGVIMNCFATGKISGGNYIGGLVGSSRGPGSKIAYSYSTADVTGNNYTGVLVGILLDSCCVEKSWSEGTVNATGKISGGLAGYCGKKSSICECYSASAVNSESHSAGGLCGTIGYNAIIKNSYATGDVSCVEQTGGLIGWADSSQIVNCYSAGYVVSETGISAGSFVGGGSDTEIIHSFWNRETSGQPGSAGGEGKTTQEMVSRTTFIQWNFDTIWSMDENNTYPYLQWQEGPGAHNYPAVNITISAQTTENGSITPTGEVEVPFGNAQVFDIVPDEGFRLAYIKIDSISIDLETDENWDADSRQYTFTSVKETHTIEVGFEDATAVKNTTDQHELKVYPNPAKNELWIEFNSRGGDKPLIVLQNLTGQIIKQGVMSEAGPVRKRMSTHDLTPGVYLLSIRGKQECWVKKVMIEK